MSSILHKIKFQVPSYDIKTFLTTHFKISKLSVSKKKVVKRIKFDFNVTSNSHMFNFITLAIDFFHTVMVPLQERESQLS